MSSASSAAGGNTRSAPPSCRRLAWELCDIGPADTCAPRLSPLVSVCGSFG
jgi:hypothetical protein